MTELHTSPINPGLFSRITGLLLRPNLEWPIIAAEQTTVKRLFTGYAAILAAIPALCSLIYNIMSAHHSVAGALVISVIGYALSLLSVYIVGIVIEGIAHSFGSNRDILQSHKLAVYAMTPAWLAGVFNIIGWDPVGSLVGIYGFVLMFKGLTPLKHTPEGKRFMYTLSVILVALLVNGGIWALMGAVMTSFAIVGAGPSAFALS